MKKSNSITILTSIVPLYASPFWSKIIFKFILAFILVLNITSCGREGKLYLEKDPINQDQQEEAID